MMSLPTASSSLTSVNDFKQSTFPSSRTLTDVSPLSRQSTLAATSATPPKKGLHFWLVMVAICVSLFLSALEYVSLAVDVTRGFRLTTYRPPFLRLSPRSRTI